MLTSTRLQNDGAVIQKFKPLVAIALVALCYFSIEDGIYSSFDPGQHSFQDVSSLVFASLGFLLQALGIGFPTALTGITDQRLRSDDPKAVGLFSLMRTPIDAGEFLAWLALPILVGSKILIFVYILGFFLFYERIVLHREKALLQRHGDRYLSWCMRTPIIIPKRTRWSKSTDVFSWRRIAIASRMRFTGLLVALCILEFSKYYSKGTLSTNLVSNQWRALALVAAIAMCLSYSPPVAKVWFRRFKFIFTGDSKRL